jgi:hypothetical protein
MGGSDGPRERAGRQLTREPEGPKIPTRYIWLAPEDFTLALGSPTLGVVGDNANAVNRPTAWQFPSGSKTAVTTNFVVPSDWTGGAITVVYHWSRAAGTNGTVSGDWVWSQVAEGEQVDEGGAAVSATPADPATPENLLRTTIGTFTPGAYRTIRGAVRRLSGGFAGNAWLIGVELPYPAS